MLGATARFVDPADRGLSECGGRRMHAFNMSLRKGFRILVGESIAAKRRGHPRISAITTGPADGRRRVRTIRAAIP